MNIARATRKTLIATLIVPAIALTAVSVESFSGFSDAKAQQAGAGRGGNNGGGGSSSGGGNNGGGSRGGEGRGENPYLLMRGDCVQTPGTALVDCPPPPRKVEMTEMSDCSCEVNYRTVGGQRVAVKDCYVEIGETMRYCRRDTIAVR